MEGTRQLAGAQYVASLDNQADRYTDATQIRLKEDMVQHGSAVHRFVNRMPQFIEIKNGLHRAAQMQAAVGRQELQAVFQEAKAQAAAAQQVIQCSLYCAWYLNCSMCNTVLASSSKRRRARTRET